MQTSTQVGGRTRPPALQGAGAKVSQQSCPWLTKQKKQKTKKKTWEPAQPLYTPHFLICAPAKFYSYVEMHLQHPRSMSRSK